LSHYAGQFFEDTPIKCRFELPIASSSFVLPAEIRHDLFLAVKEALNNVLKHSGASEVLVQVSAQEETVQIVIRDNGRGIDPGETASGRKGNGLANMRQRVEGRGGRFDLDSVSGKGTRLSLSLRVKQPAIFVGSGTPS
jgi:signal transduction histidine kinase